MSDNRTRIDKCLDALSDSSHERLLCRALLDNSAELLLEWVAVLDDPGSDDALKERLRTETLAFLATVTDAA